ncbi:MAG: hypothetical protein JW795_01685, partial [Chitinivibrionales bacterium]|nr:hypothetical protein [Chitinivibrionales bacterium]
EISNARVVLLPELFAAFPRPDTIPGAEKIWFGLQWIYAHWKTPFRYLVFFGDDSIQIDAVAATVKSVGRVPSNIWNVVKTQNEMEFNYSDDIYTMLQSDKPVFDEKQYAIPLYSGRIPAETAEQAECYINKLIAFDTTVAGGRWKNGIVFSADDEFRKDGEIDVVGHHTTCEYASIRMAGFFASKCYLSEYRKDMVQFPSNARTDYFQQINKGALLNVYFGHGNSVQLTDENFLRADHAGSFQNIAMPTVTIAFTSYNGAFYNPASQSMAKTFLFLAKGGSLLYIAATGLTYASSNAQFGDTLLGILRKNQNADIGTVVRMAKQITPLHEYHVLGDPAVKLFRLPAQLSINSVQTDSQKIRLRCQFLTPLSSMSHFAYEVSLPESVVVNNGAGSVQFVKNRIVRDSAGIFGAAFPIEIPWPNRLNMPIHIDIYTWNARYESRKDTTLFLGGGTSATSIKKSPMTTELDLLAGHGYRIHLTLPLSRLEPSGRVSLFSLSGRRVFSQLITVQSDRSTVDLRKQYIPAGVYTIELMQGDARALHRAVVLY